MSAPRFLADEDLRRSNVSATRRLQPAVEFSTAVELGLSETPDSDILEFALTNGWLVVSHDVNTMKAAAEDRLRNAQGIAGLSSGSQMDPCGSSTQTKAMLAPISSSGHRSRLGVGSLACV